MKLGLLLRADYDYRCDWPTIEQAVAKDSAIQGSFFFRQERAGT